MSFWLTSGSWCVYKIVNTINDKLYIGLTRTPDKRWQQHLYYARPGRSENGALYVDMRKYGVDKFRMEIIEECPDMAQGFKRERHWIQTLSTIRPDGYNSTCGYTAQEKQDVGGPYSVYTYANSLTNEIFSIKIGLHDEWMRYIKDAQSGRDATNIVKAIRSIWQQGGKIIIRKLYTNLSAERANQLRNIWLHEHKAKLWHGGSVLESQITLLTLVK